MRRSAFAAALLLASGCASWRALPPGPTPEGFVVLVPAAEKAAARREAVEAALPLFLSDDARSARASAVEDRVLARAADFVGRERLARRRKGEARLPPSAVEVRVDKLSGALLSTGLLQPAGFPLGSEPILLALGDPAAPAVADRAAAQSLETALFGRGLEAQDARDPLVPLKRPLESTTTAELVLEAARDGWPRLVTGRTALAAERDASSGAWRGSARLDADFYELRASSAAQSFTASGRTVELSSASAISRAIDQATAEAALRISKLIERGRAGRTTIAVLLDGYKDPAYVRRVIDDLRAAPGVAGASLIAWNGPEGMTLVRAFAVGLTAETLTAELLERDSSLRVSGIESEDGRLTLDGPDIPESQDRGE
ncbi:MAG: hypothetical protein KGM24_04995 [Elusimicrobia bacterium]|nr:hypothetical protein [Elusimicrobiota bacterium]